MKFFSLIILLFLLTSCFSKSSPNTLNQNVPPAKSPAITTSGQSVVSEKEVDTSDPKYLKQIAIEKIENIKSLDELAKLYPHVAKAEKKDHPKFLELEKKKILLGMESDVETSKKNSELYMRMSDIHQGTEIWPDSLKKLDEAQKTAVKNSKGNLKDPKIIKASEAWAKEFLAFKESEEYKKFYASKEKELGDIMKNLNDLATPRAKKLQEEVMSLSREVYTN